MALVKIHSTLEVGEDLLLNLVIYGSFGNGGWN